MPGSPVAFAQRPPSLGPSAARTISQTQRRGSGPLWARLTSHRTVPAPEEFARETQALRDHLRAAAAPRGLPFAEQEAGDVGLLT
jgi:hypothetical protein